jgi:hypothetical protein
MDAGAARALGAERVQPLSILLNGVRRCATHHCYLAGAELRLPDPLLGARTSAALPLLSSYTTRSACAGLSVHSASLCSCSLVTVYADAPESATRIPTTFCASIPYPPISPGSAHHDSPERSPQPRRWGAARAGAHLSVDGIGEQHETREDDGCILDLGRHLVRHGGGGLNAPAQRGEGTAKGVGSMKMNITTRRRVRPAISRACRTSMLSRSQAPPTWTSPAATPAAAAVRMR